MLVAFCSVKSRSACSVKQPILINPKQRLNHINDYHSISADKTTRFFWWLFLTHKHFSNRLKIPTPKHKMTKLLAFQNCKHTKESAVALAEWHEKEDRFIKGTYGEKLGEGWKGCSVGCMTNGANHYKFAEFFALDPRIAGVADFIFENLPKGKYESWTTKLFRSIKDGSDTSQNVDKFFAWLMLDQKYGMYAIHKHQSILDVGNLFQRSAKGEYILETEWLSNAALAATTAWAASVSRAARAASADSSARADSSVRAALAATTAWAASVSRAASADSSARAASADSAAWAARAASAASAVWDNSDKFVQAMASKLCKCLAEK
jgi:hypothetical protein